MKSDRDRCCPTCPTATAVGLAGSRATPTALPPARPSPGLAWPSVGRARAGAWASPARPLAAPAGSASGDGESGAEASVGFERSCMEQTLRRGCDSLVPTAPATPATRPPVESSAAPAARPPARPSAGRVRLWAEPVGALARPAGGSRVRVAGSRARALDGFERSRMEQTLRRGCDSLAPTARPAGGSRVRVAGSRARALDGFERSRMEQTLRRGCDSLAPTAPATPTTRPPVESSAAPAARPPARPSAATCSLPSSIARPRTKPGPSRAGAARQGCPAKPTTASRPTAEHPRCQAVSAALVASDALTQPCRRPEPPHCRANPHSAPWQHEARIGHRRRCAL